MDPGSDRYIRVQMHLKGNFLFVKCVNSSADEASEAPARTERERKEHGYGLAAMRRVAEKCGSILLVERRDGEFEVRSNLCLRREQGEK